MAGLVNGGTILEGRLILSLDSGEILDLGYVQGPTGLTGPTGAQGLQGRPGKDGNGLLHGAGVPVFDDGKDGDFFIDTKAMKFYGPKVAGKWGSGVPLLPKDRGMQLPTGMRAQGGAAGARAFAAGISGPSSGGAIVAGGGNGSLKTIEDHNLPLPAGSPVIDPVTGKVTTPATWKTIAIDTDGGDAMIVDIFAEAPAGSLLVEVAAMRDKNNLTGYSEVYEVRTGTAPILHFQTGTTPTGQLTLQVYSETALDTLRGRVLYI